MINAAAITSTEVVAPVIGQIRITIRDWEIYRPPVVRNESAR